MYGTKKGVCYAIIFMHALRRAIGKKDKLKRAEAVSRIVQTEEISEVALLPAEASPQIADVFLSAKLLPECETYYMQETREITESEIEAWNKRVEEVLESMPGIVEDERDKNTEAQEVTQDDIRRRMEDVLGWQ